MSRTKNAYSFRLRFWTKEDTEFLRFWTKGRQRTVENLDRGGKRICEILNHRGGQGKEEISD